jgi:hypothetical protein
MKTPMPKKHRDKFAAMLSSDKQYKHLLNTLFAWRGLDTAVNDEDTGLNTIPIQSWDDLADSVWGYAIGVRGPKTMSYRVCVLKEAVRQMRDGTIERPCADKAKGQPITS